MQGNDLILSDILTKPPRLFINIYTRSSIIRDAKKRGASRCLVMGPSPALAWAQPGPVYSFGAFRARPITTTIEPLSNSLLSMLSIKDPACKEV